MLSEPMNFWSSLTPNICVAEGKSASGGPHSTGPNESCKSITKQFNKICPVLLT